MNRFWALLCFLFTLSSYADECNIHFDSSIAKSSEKISKLIFDNGKLHNAVAFDELSIEDMAKFASESFNEARAQLQKIINSKSKPTIENTLLPLEKLDNNILFTFLYADNLKLFDQSNERLSQLLSEVRAEFDQFSREIYQNEKLYKRVKKLYEKKSNYQEEINKYVEKVYNRFKNQGLNLSPENKILFAKLTKELQEATEKWVLNLSESKNFVYVVLSADELEGVPKSYMKNMAAKAKEKGHVGKYVIDYLNNDYYSVMSFASNPKTQEKIYKTSFLLGNTPTFDNKELTKKIARLRDEKAKLLGYKSHAHYVLSMERMAETPEKATEFIQGIKESAKYFKEKDDEALMTFFKEKTGRSSIKPWERAYYSRLYQNETYRFDSEALKPYFELEQTLEGVFQLAATLYDIEFIKVSLPKYRDDVLTYRVYDKKLKQDIGLFYHDLFAREGKKGGAWMYSFRLQALEGDKRIQPLILNALNITKPAEGPTLLSFDEVNTLLHELGHGLHGLLSDVRLKSMASVAGASELYSTSELLDFVEVPSTFMENYLMEESFLKTFAKHYETGEVIPMELVEKLKQASVFGQGNRFVVQANYALLDLAWHTPGGEKVDDIYEFEQKIFERTQEDRELTPEFIRSTTFSHFFSEPMAYSAGYYSYLMSEGISAALFEYVKKNNLLYDKNFFKSYRDNMLSRGLTIEPLKAFKKITGSEPDPAALLRLNGLVEDEASKMTIKFDANQAKPIEEIRELILNNKNPDNTWAFDKLTTDDVAKFAVDAFERARKGIQELSEKKTKNTTFNNFIKPFEKLDDELSYIFSHPLNISQAIGGEKNEALYKDMLIEFGRFKKEIYQNEAIFNKFNEVANSAAFKNLSHERQVYIQRILKRFQKEGFYLEKEARQRLSQIDATLQENYSKFSENLKETIKELSTEFEVSELEGVPKSVLDSLADLAQKKKLPEGSYLLTYQSQVLASQILSNAKSPATREKVYNALSLIGRYKNYQNAPVIKEIAKLRHERATLLGYKSYAHMIINEDDRMVGSPEKAYELSIQVREKVKPYLEKDEKILEDYYHQLEGADAPKMKPWDKSYYSKLLMKEKYSFDGDQLKPYFEFNNTLQAVFDLTEKLYNVKATITDLPGFTKDSPVIKVENNETGEVVGYVYLDYQTRDGKKGGAWMLTMGLQSTENGKRKVPFASAVMNFVKPDSGPLLLTHGEVETLAHEWGHVLHGIFSDVEMKSMASISGPSDLHETSELMDFSEAPSTFMENYFSEIDFLSQWAKHYETGESIPAELIQAMKKSQDYGSAAFLDRWAATNLLDLAWHSESANKIGDVKDFEYNIFDLDEYTREFDRPLLSLRIGHYFASSEYAAGYYVYMYSEIISAALFEHIKSNGLLYDREFFKRFRENMLSQGTVMSPMEEFIKLTGSEPDVEALIKNKGIDLVADKARELFKQTGVNPLNALPLDQIDHKILKSYFDSEYDQMMVKLQELIDSPKKPTFKNFILELESMNEELEKASGIVFNRYSMSKSPEIEKLNSYMSEKLAVFGDLFSKNETIYKKIIDVMEAPSFKRLSKEDRFLVTKYKETLEESGVQIKDPEVKRRLLEIEIEATKVSQDWTKKLQVSRQENKFLIHDDTYLDEVPKEMLEMAQENAQEQGLEGYLFDGQGRLTSQTLQYISDEATQKELYRVYTNVAKAGENNTHEEMLKLLEYRQEFSELMGFEDYASYSTSKKMVRNKETVYDFLGELIEKTRIKMEKDELEFKEFIQTKYNGEVQIKPWNRSYYFRIFKEEKANLSDEMLKPYFEFEQTLKGIQNMVKEKFNVEFREVTNIPTLEDGVKTFIVVDSKTGKEQGLFYLDIYQRENKRDGAWMSSYLDQSQKRRPHIINVLNVSRPKKGRPTLLTLYEVETLLHELGHGLHGLLSQVKYSTYSGTSVIWDFVEVPSTIMESFLYEEWFLKSFAKHYQTNEPIPSDLIERIIANKNFHTARSDLSLYLWALMDMKLHTKEYQGVKDLAQFEDEVFEEGGFPVTDSNLHRVFQFNHIWGGFHAGYSAGYYLYYWSDFLASDAFQEMKNAGFSKDVMMRWRKNILEKGGLDHPMDNYDKFKQGKKPDPNAILRSKGILPEEN